MRSYSRCASREEDEGNCTSRCSGSSVSETDSEGKDEVEDAAERDCDDHHDIVRWTVALVGACFLLLACIVFAEQPTAGSFSAADLDYGEPKERFIPNKGYRILHDIRRSGNSPLPPELFQTYGYTYTGPFHPRDWWQIESHFNATRLGAPDAVGRPEVANWSANQSSITNRSLLITRLQGRGEDVSEEALWEVVSAEDGDSGWEHTDVDKNSDIYKISMAKCALTVNSAVMGLFAAAVTTDSASRTCSRSPPYSVANCGDDVSAIITTLLWFGNIVAYAPAFCGMESNLDAFCSGDGLWLAGGIANLLSNSFGIAADCTKDNNHSVPPFVRRLKELDLRFEETQSRLEALLGLRPFEDHAAYAAAGHRSGKQLDYSEQREWLYARHRRAQHRLRDLLKGRTPEAILDEWAHRYEVDRHADVHSLLRRQEQRRQKRIAHKAREAALEAAAARRMRAAKSSRRLDRTRENDILSCAILSESVLASLVESAFAGWTTDKVCGALGPGSGREEKANCAANVVGMVNILPNLARDAADLSSDCPSGNHPAACIADVLDMSSVITSYGALGATIDQDCKDSSAGRR